MILIPLRQKSQEWYDWRHSGIGGSDAPVIMGASPYSTRTQLLEEKATKSNRPGNWATSRGTRLEPVAAELYAIKNPYVNCQSACVQSERVPWLLASLDLLVTDDLEVPQRIGEVKCWKWQNHDLVLQGICPKEVFPQIQHQLAATGLLECDLVSYSDNRKFGPEEQLAVLRVRADLGYQDELLEAEQAFWDEVLQAREMA